MKCWIWLLSLSVKSVTSSYTKSHLIKIEEDKIGLSGANVLGTKGFLNIPKWHTMREHNVPLWNVPGAIVLDNMYTRTSAGNDQSWKILIWTSIQLWFWRWGCYCTVPCSLLFQFTYSMTWKSQSFTRTIN